MFRIFDDQSKTFDITNQLMSKKTSGKCFKKAPSHKQNENFIRHHGRDK